MPGNLPTAGGSGEGASVTPAAEPQGTGRGRKRYCKKCKFTCTDAREFTAHQTAHSDSDENNTGLTSASTSSALQSRRTLRPKRNSKGSISERDTPSSAMELAKDAFTEASLAKDVKTIDFGNNNNAPLVIDTEQTVKPIVKSSEHSESNYLNLSGEADKELMDGDEDEDEPDAMTTPSFQQVTNVHRDGGNESKLPSDITNYFSADEDEDDKDKLVIAGDSLAKTPTKLNNVQARTYSCQHCEMTTTNARSYLHHLIEDHKTQVCIYECDSCSYATVYKQKLNKHRQIHVLAKEDDQLNMFFDSTEKTPQKKIDERINFNKFSFLNPSKHSSFMIEKTEDMDDDDDDDDDTSVMDHKSGFTLTITPENIDQVLDEDKKKKKKTRQEVDPGKYFEAVDSSGTKYACSQCGNIYKWRKSLNKHWKEKHSMDPLVEVASPPGMLELLKSGKYTQLGARRIYDKSFLATIKTNKSDDPTHITSSPHSLTQSQSPQNFLMSASVMASAGSSRLTSSVTSLNSKMIGPFVANTAQPVFPGMAMPLSHIALHNNGYASPEESALDLTRDNNPSSRSSPYIAVSGQDHNTSFDQEQPLDFSKNKNAIQMVKHEKPWENINSMKPAHSINQLIPRLHHCSKCDFTSTSEVEFANHTSSHLNKRIVRCYECKLQFNSMDELNNHFIKLHFRKLTEYKEAIKKIPHGLQQTYHILNMNINEIGELGNQDLGASEGKSLKCKKCDFEAKWPAELQKHAVSHSEERPYICMVCGSTYKWKWDLVKHFQKSHPNLPNPYRRNDNKDTPDGSTEDEDEPVAKRVKLETNSIMMNGSLFSRDDISVEGIIAATQAGQRLVSSQPNILDDEPTMERNMAFLNDFPYAGSGDISQVSQMVQAAQAAQEIDRRNKIQKAMQDAARNRQNSSGSSGSGSGKKNGGGETGSLSPGGSKSSEDLPYKCTMCNYHARWPSEVTQHMKNHSDSKPYLCPRCEYRSKWKWDVVKHLKRCGGGGINDVIDTTKGKKRDYSMSNGPPNVVVSQQGKVKKMTPQPSYIPSPASDNGMHSTLVIRSGQDHASDASSGDDLSRPGSSSSTHDLSNSSNNNNDSSANENNVNNNYAAYTNGLPFESLNSLIPATATVLSTMGSINSSNSPALSPVPSPATHTANSRQSGEIWNCPHCPFSTQSQAELKRHSGLHSDDKPFKCDVCQYSTRWACDLKKHRKSYNHFSRTNIPKDDKEKPQVAQGRFKCTQCTLFFQTLQSLLDHRMAEHIGQDSSQSSPAPLTEIEIDAARIKHPRKQVKKIECTKCPFVCKSRQTMEKHMDEHEQLELSGIYCFYCSSLFKDKETLLDHITTHSTFNPKEWETFFMISDEDQHHVKNDGKLQGKKDSKSQQSIMDKAEATQGSNQLHKKYTENEKLSTDSTEARIKQILNEVPKQLTASQHVPHMNKFKCEWCPAEFVNLTAVYKHASQAHPIQLKEQDVSMAFSGQTRSLKLSSGQKLLGRKLYAGEPIDILKQQIAEKRNHLLLDKNNETETSGSKMQDTVCTNNEEERSGKLYQCDKSSLPSANFTMFQSHHELNGSKMTSQCWFCDYSVDQMNLLYQHMKISHTRKWKALSQDPKYASQIHRMNLAFTSPSIHGNNDNVPETSQVIDFSAMDLSSKSKPSHSEVTHDIRYITRQQHTWSGIPVNIVPVGNALNFVCPLCAFRDASIAETCCHVIQNHRAMSKFTCKTCLYSDDNIHVMSDHCKNEHPIHERIVEVLDFKQINFSELQIVQLNAVRKQMVGNDWKKKSKTKTDTQTVATKAMSCPFCPFKTLVTEHMKMHVSDHSKQARYRCQVCDFSSDSPAVISEHNMVHGADYTMDYRSFTDNKLQVAVKKEPKDRKMNEPDSNAVTRVGIISEHSELNPNDQEGSPRCKLNKRIRYRCSVCPYHTTCKSNIVKHVRQHNNNKKYKCTKCSYGAARAVLLKNHLDSHEAPVEDDGQYHDIFCDPNSLDDALKADNNDDNESEETEMDVEDFDDEIDEDDAHSDDSDENDVKAIVDLEAKDILEAEAAHTSSVTSDDVDSVDKQFRKQKCPHCPFSSNSGYEFRKHLNFHGTQERYKCDHCSYSLDRLNLLSQHRRLHADEPGYNPNPPAADLLNTSFILQHSSGLADTEDMLEANNFEEGRSEVSISQFSCLNCPYKTSKKNLFDIHCNSHDLRKRYICDFCDWSADRMGLLYQHRRVHQDEPTYIPSPEEKVFLNQEFDDGTSGEFEAKFMEIKHVDKPVEEGEPETPLSPPFKLTVVKKSYPCKLCPFKTNSKNSYSIHKSMHDSGAEFSCTECSYASVNKGLLQQHLHLHITAGANVCSPTSSAVRSPLTRQQSLDTEMTNVQQDTNSQFSLTKESQRTANQLDIQTGPELKCQRCPFTASSQNVLRDHIRCHTAQDNLSCPFCDFSTTSRQVMFPHIQIHFPGRKLDSERLEHMLEEHTRATNNNVHSSFDLPKSLSPRAEKIPAQPESVTTKRVYVCHFCEREFEAKDLMIQHEKQHLVGGQAEDA